MCQNDKKRVVLIRSNPIRPYPRLEKMANCLVKNGYQVTVLAWDRDVDYAPKTQVLTLQSGDVPIVRVGIKGQFSGGLKKNLKGLLKFQCFIVGWLWKNKNHYDIIHAYDFDTGFTAQRCAKCLKKKFIYDIPDYYVDSHGLYKKPIGKLVKWLEDRVITKADATIICTEQREEQIKDAHPKELAVIHNTPDIGITGEFRHPGEKLKLVYVGIFGKNRFIDKIVEVVSKRDDCEFHIGGFGANMEGYFEEVAQKYSNIFYYGRIPYAQAIQLERDCDVMCALYNPKVPNHYYAAPNKFYEALMLGKPLIMAKNTGMASIVAENDIGMVIDYNEDALDAALTELINRTADWERIAKTAQTLYTEKYAWTEMERRIVELYNKVSIPT